MSTVKYVVYNRNTGEIECSGICAAQDLKLQKRGKSVLQTDIQNVSDLTHYVLNGKVTKKLTNPVILSKNILIADGIDSVIISNLPLSIVRISDTDYEIFDGKLEFTLDLPGVYPISIKAFPYLDVLFEVIAT